MKLKDVLEQRLKQNLRHLLQHRLKKPRVTFQPYLMSLKRL